MIFVTSWREIFPLLVRKDADSWKGCSESFKMTANASLSYNCTKKSSGKIVRLPGPSWDLQHMDMHMKTITLSNHYQRNRTLQCTLVKLVQFFFFCFSIVAQASEQTSPFLSIHTMSLTTWGSYNKCHFPFKWPTLNHWCKIDDRIKFFPADFPGGNCYFFLPWS